jgi:hypothetical protein
MTLDLDHNDIGAEGARHLMQALQDNRVRQVFFLSIVNSPLRSNTDAHYTHY